MGNTYEDTVQAFKEQIENMKASEQRAWAVVETIRAARVREANAILAMEIALMEALPLLIRLGDFIGNGENRCHTILTVRKALQDFRDAQLPVTATWLHGISTDEVPKEDWPNE